MGKITRDTHDDEKNYHKVLAQRGQPLTDAELNELQDNAVVHRVETAHSASEGYRASQEGLEEHAIPAIAKGDSFTATGGTADITLASGPIFVEGFRVVFPSDVSMAAQSGISFEATPAADTYGFVYMELVQQEITSADDPNIATAQLGETSRRERINVVFKHVESGTDFATAFGLIPAGSPAAGDRLWNGNIARVLVCRYFRASGVAAIADGNIWSYRQPSPSELLGNLGPWVQTHKPYQTAGAWAGTTEQGKAAVDGMVIWNRDDTRLIIGSLEEDGSGDITADPEIAYRSGLSLIFPSATTSAGRTPAVISATRGVERLSVGAGSADGTPVLQETPTWAKGFLIAEGEALGYISTTTGATAYNNLPPAKNADNTAVSELVQATPLPATYSANGEDPSAILIQELVSLPLREFQDASPQSFVLCANINGDLHWWNKQVTRGIVGRPVCEELGSTPTPWSAVIASEGSSHFTNDDGIERAVNWLKSGVAGDFGLSRNLAFRVQRGSYTFTRLLHVWGTSTELTTSQNVEGYYDADNNGLEIIGEGPAHTRAVVQASSNASTSIFGNVNIVVNRVHLKGVTFKGATATASLYGRYSMYVEANDVIIEDCVFEDGGLYIKANNIQVLNCRFPEISNASENHHVQSFPGNPHVGQHLRCEPRTLSGTAGQSSWVIRNNKFQVTQQNGTHASLVLAGDIDPADRQLLIEIDHNIWKYDGVLVTDQAAIHLDMDYGDVEMHHNRFVGAQGVSKTGADISTTVAPFNADYLGSPLSIPGGTDGVASQIVTNAYISITDERRFESQTSVHHNYFDLASVLSTGRYRMWGAMIVYPSFLTMGASGILANIDFSHNTLKMGDGTTEWAGAGDNPVTWGFYIAASTPDGNSITNLVMSGITASDNTFHLGGESATRFMWRCIRNESVASWPTGGTGYLTDPSCLIGLQLKNQDSGAGAATGRHGYGIAIERNKIMQRHPGAGSAPLAGAITFIDSDADYWWSWCIVLCQGVVNSFVNTDPTAWGNSLQGEFIAAEYALHAPRVCDNWFWAQGWADATQSGVSAASKALTAADPCLVLISGANRPVVADNFFAAGAGGNDGFSSVYFRNLGRHAWFTGNQSASPDDNIVRGQGSALGTLACSNNMWKDLPVITTATLDTDFDGGADGSNFNK